ncbi:T9SS type A sorting domain-containing protein [bacterium]|nr:MAG: T9SS type A sorting domain-containing protein [bacterium]
MNTTIQKRLLILIAMILMNRNVFAQQDFREESIYFLLTTRFFDGDSTNNRPNEWSSYNPDPTINPGITDPQDVTWRGDFKGLIEKLDYIKDLGFTAIWITPVVQNWSPLDYHGYHAYDFTKVDPRLESPGATFQDLIYEIHARDMKIVLDIVTNHSGRYGIKGQAEIKYNTDPSQSWGKDKNGNPLQPNPNWEYDGLTQNPDDGKIWSRANLPTMPAPFNENLAAYNWPGKENYVDTSDPDWYHHSGNGFAQGYDDLENLYNRALAGDTPDLNTGSQKVREYLVNAYKTFIEMGVDAFRWDTIKHMSKEDVLYFLDAFKEINPDLFVFGEVAQKRHELHNLEEINPHWYTWRGATNNSEPSGLAVLDFFAMSTFHMFPRGDNMSNVMAAARYDYLYADPSTNILFLDNHDFGPNNDWNQRYGGTDENLAAVLNFMWTWRGIPTLYYGTEMRFKSGAYTDIKDEQGTRESIDKTGRAYYGNVMGEAPDHIIYKHIKKLNAIRKAVPALQKGSWKWAGNGGGNGVGYVRDYNDGESYAIVGLAKDGNVTFTFTDIKNGTYKDAVTGAEVSVSNGSLQFTVSPSSAGVYVLDGSGIIGDLGVGFFQTTSNPGEGSGGNGGNSEPAQLAVLPLNPAPGQQVSVTYNGFLNSESQVNMYWGFDNWNDIKTSSMNKNGEVWTVTITVPSQASNKINMVFNNGNGTWDNNNSNDYAITLSQSSSGETGDKSLTWLPLSPTKDDVITLTVNTTDKVNMHWGVNSWNTPDNGYRPANTFQANGAIQSPFELDNGKRVIQIGPFNSSQQVSTVNFVLYYPDSNSWDNNSSQDYRIDVSQTTSIEYESPKYSLKLHQNYPNPFNPSTTISFELPESEFVNLTIYTVLGEKVADLVSGERSKGIHTVRFDGSTLSSGVYIYRMESQSGVISKRMTLIK